MNTLYVTEYRRIICMNYHDIPGKELEQRLIPHETWNPSENHYSANKHRPSTINHYTSMANQNSATSNNFRKVNIPISNLI